MCMTRRRGLFFSRQLPWVPGYCFHPLARSAENDQGNRLAQRHDESSRIQSGIDSLLILTVPVHAPGNHPVINRVPRSAQRCRCNGNGTEREESPMNSACLSLSSGHWVHSTSWCSSFPGVVSPKLPIQSFTDFKDGLKMVVPGSASHHATSISRSRAVEAASNTYSTRSVASIPCVSGLGSSKKVKYARVLPSRNLG